MIVRFFEHNLKGSCFDEIFFLFLQNRKVVYIRRIVLKMNELSNNNKKHVQFRNGKRFYVVVRDSVIFGLVGLIWIACAKQGFPEGGPRDVTPPQVLQAKPASGQKNFQEKGFEIEFDEYVVLKDAENNILVSPPMSPKPEYKMSGKKLKVNLRDTLQRDVTYVFQFKGAIADFNEGNPLPSLVYAFSTGDVIDSMMIRGKVEDAFSHKAREKDVSVLAFEGGDDSVVSKGKPLYITKCDKEGNFAFDFIRPGSYRIIALEDGDKNMQYNGDEAIAFLDTLVEARVRLSDSATKSEVEEYAIVRMRMSAKTHPVQRITKSEFVRSGRIEITTMLPMEEPQITPDNLRWHLGVKRDTLTIWMAEEKCDSARIVVSDPSGLQDTLKLRYHEKRNSKGKGGLQKGGVAPLMKSLVKDKVSTFDTLWLAFDNPVVANHADSAVQVMNLRDSSLSRCGVRMSADGLRAQILLEGKAETKYRLTLGKGSFTDLYGKASDSLSINTEIVPLDQFGNIILTVSLAEEMSAEERAGQVLVQLTNEKGDVLHCQAIGMDKMAPGANPVKVSFMHLAAGKYKVQIILDRNSNGEWDAGDYWEHQQPEEVYYFEKTLELRQNWDIEEKVEVR